MAYNRLEKPMGGLIPWFGQEPWGWHTGWHARSITGAFFLGPQQWFIPHDTTFTLGGGPGTGVRRITARTPPPVTSPEPCQSLAEGKEAGIGGGIGRGHT